MITVRGMIEQLNEWPLEAKVIVTLLQGDKTLRRFEITEMDYEKEQKPDEEVAEIIISEEGEF